VTIWQSLIVARRALGANKLRTALTMLGIIIGVGAVIALMSIGRGAQASVTAQIQSLGTNLLFIRPGSTQQGGVRAGASTSGSLTLEDAEALDSPGVASLVAGVAPELNGGAQLSASGQNWGTRVIGTTPNYPDVRNFPVKLGDFVTRQQLEARSLVVVLGANVASNLFGEGDPIGQPVRASFNGRSPVTLRVIGVMESKGGTGLGNQDDQIFVPITTMAARLSVQRTARGGISVSTINVQVTSEKQMQAAIDQVAEVLRQRHRVATDDFTIQSQEDFLQTFTQITGTFTVLLGSIAGISLLVGGIGIMNIMLVSVTERTREIGIRKAVGARRKDILSQFLVEAVLVSALGGLIGIAIGWGVSRLLNGVPFGAQPIQTLVAPDAVLLAFGVSALVGIFFGFYPATRAARLHPIEALRYE
jgi:putative ABC transport system permease protein